MESSGFMLTRVIRRYFRVMKLQQSLLSWSWIVIKQYWECLGSLPRILLLIGVTERFYSRVIEQRKFPLHRESKCQKSNIVISLMTSTVRQSKFPLHRESKCQKSRNVISLMTIVVRRRSIESWCYRIVAILIYWIRLTIVLRVFLVFIRWRIQWYRLL